MLTKNQTLKLEEQMIIKAMHIASLINVGEEEKAFIKYDSARGVFDAIGFKDKFNETVRWQLIERHGYTQTQWDGFRVSHIDYRKGYVSTIKFTK